MEPKNDAGLILDQMELFNKVFRFKVGDSVRHKADTKDWSADMGLLVTARYLVEESGDGENEIIFKRLYECRMIKLSGSGERGTFREHELMTLDEYAVFQTQQRERTQEVMNESKQTQKEVYAAFGVTKDTHVRVKSDSTGREYRPCGYSFKKGEGMKLKLVSIIKADNLELDYADVSKVDEIEIIQPQSPQS